MIPIENVAAPQHFQFLEFGNMSDMFLPLRLQQPGVDLQESLSLSVTCTIPAMTFSSPAMSP